MVQQLAMAPVMQWLVLVLSVQCSTQMMSECCCIAGSA